MPRGDGQKQNRIWKRCLICGEKFWVHWYRRNDAKYCGHACTGRALRKVKKRPTKEQLQHLIRTCTLVEIGKQYGVDGSLIVHWLKECGLRPLSRGEYRRVREAAKVEAKSYERSACLNSMVVHRSVVAGKEEGMGAAPTSCRTCVYFKRGQHRYSSKINPNRYFSDCEKKKWPTHANCSACSDYEKEPSVDDWLEQARKRRIEREKVEGDD